MSALGLAAAVWLSAGADAVLLLRSNDPSRSAFEERVAAELYASGFQVRSVPAGVVGSTDVPGQLWARCQQEGARAALWVAPRGDGSIDVWAAEAESSKAVVRTWSAPDTYSQRATLALKAVELLHATLLETGALEAEDPDLPSGHVRFKQRFKPYWTFGTGLGLLVTPGGLRPEPLLELQLGYELRHDFAIDVQLGSSVWPARFIQSDGDADIGIAFLRVMGQWTPLRAGPFAFSLVGGTGALLLWMSGATSPDPTEPPSYEVRIGWMFSIGPSIALELIDRVRLQLVLTAGATVPMLVAEVARMQVATVQPLFDTLLRLQFE